MSLIPENKCLSNYTIEKVIGNGTFGCVFLANKKESNDKVALKICPLWSNETASYLKNEIFILSLIDSPFFPSFYNCNDHGSFFIIAFEYCPGNTLQEYLEIVKKVDEKIILKILEQLLDALFYLHGHRIIHRDLKLENIIINNKLEIKICDFGLAIFCAKDQLQLDFCGTLQYCSPEIVNQVPYEGESNDIWTVGICILKMCLGIDKFNEISMGEPILGYYSIFDSLIENKMIRNVLKRILVDRPNKRAKLKDIYKLINRKEPTLEYLNVKFIDPIVIDKMNSLNLSTKNICNKIQNVNLPEFHIYRFILEKIYLKINKENNNEYFNINEIYNTIERTLINQRSFVCCYSKVYIPLFFIFESNIELLLNQLSNKFVILNNKRIRMINKMTIIDFVKVKSGIKIVLVAGEIEDFVESVFIILTEFAKISNGIK